MVSCCGGQALELHPLDFNGLADPYLVIRCGRNKVNDKENKILNDLNPIFGRYDIMRVLYIILIIFIHQMAVNMKCRNTTKKNI